MIIDVHAHIGRIRQAPEATLDVDDLLRKMDAWEIDRSCILPLSEHPDVNYRDSDTADILAACATHPDRLVPFCLVDPRIDGDRADTDFRPLLRRHVDAGCVGLGEFLPVLPFDDARCMNLYRQAGELGLPVLFDINDTPDSYGLRDRPGLPGLERALRECPDTVFIGHGPTFWAEISGDVTEADRTGYPGGPVAPDGAVPRLMNAYANLWADTSAGSGQNALTRDPAFGVEFLKTWNERLLFGTDSCLRFEAEPVSPNRELLRRLREEALLDEDAWERIASGNARRLLNI